MKKNTLKLLLIICIPVLGILTIFILLFNFPSRDIFQNNSIETKFKLSENDLTFFYAKDYESIDPVLLIKSKDRNDIKVLKFKSYDIYLTQLNISENFSLDSILIKKENSISINNLLWYYNYKQSDYNLNLNVDKLESIKSIYILLNENHKKFSKKIIDKNKVILFGKSNELGLRFNSEKSPLDFYYENKFTSRSLGILLYKKNNYLHSFIIISKSENEILNDEIIMKDIINVQKEIL